MSTQDIMETRLWNTFSIEHLEVINESQNHAGPATDSHFKVTLVSDDFEDLSMVKRHQLIYQLFAEELAGGVHALALHIYTPAEWEKNQSQSPQSPACRGANKKV